MTDENPGSADERSEVPIWEAEGRPQHDCFIDGVPIVVRFSPDYTPIGWDPLWPSSDDTVALVPPELLQRLIDWHDEFHRNFDDDRGWRSKEIMDAWAAEALELEAELRSALRGKAKLEVDLWPLPRGEPSWKTNGW